jgi:adenylyltransferase/sulfurtransferase
VPSCAEGGVLGVLPGLIAIVQATETVNLVTGIGEPLYGRLIQYDALRMEFNEFRVRRDPECPVCGKNPTVTELIDYEGFCGVPSGVLEDPLDEITAAALQQRLSSEDTFLLLDVREPDEYAKARIEGSTLVPLGRIEEELERLVEWKNRPVVVHCHSGVRSAKACRILLSRGFVDVTNLAGGIEAWSVTVDPTVPRY